MNRRGLLKVSTGFAGLLIGLNCAFTTWYTLDESEQALTLTFGKVTEENRTDAGLKFKAPWPIQTIEILSKETYSNTFGYTVEDGKHKIVAEEAKMLTGDENILLAGLVVQWKISNMEEYLFNSDDPMNVLYNATAASLRGVIGNTKIDSALTDGKSEIESKVRDSLRNLISRYKIGIDIVDVKLQNVDLPSEEVRTAFTQVTDAREQMNTKINEARKYQAQKENEAKGTAEAKVSQAEGARTQRIEVAKGDVANFNALYTSYKANPDITQERLVIETLEQILPGAQIYLMDDKSGNTVKYLPLQSLQQNKQEAAKEEQKDAK